MKFFENICTENKDLFYIEPKMFKRDSDKQTLSYALGATLYVPASKSNLGEYIVSYKFINLKSLVICFEDSIGDASVDFCEEQLAVNLGLVQNKLNDGSIDYELIPQIFFRFRNENQIDRLTASILKYKKLITGFVIPKITSRNTLTYFKKVKNLRDIAEKNFYIMPILESSNIIYKETRLQELKELKEIFFENQEMILNIRIGGTDFSKFFGLRRQKQHTIYDLCTVRDCISDIINFFSREDMDFVISGPVWEYFIPHKSNNIETLGKGSDSIKGLINELILDKANGLLGKTVIHPSQIDIVNSMYVVEYEEYIDAISILSSNENESGAFKSNFSDKMNEIKPHFNWAKKIIKRSEIYGVYKHGYNYLSIL